MSNTIDLSLIISCNPLGMPGAVAYRGTLTTAGNDVMSGTGTIDYSTPTLLGVGAIADPPGLIAVRCAADSPYSLKLLTLPEQFGLLAPGQFALFGGMLGSAIYVQGVTGNARMEYFAVEGPLSGTLAKTLPNATTDLVAATLDINAVMNSITSRFAAAFTSAAATRRSAVPYTLIATVDQTIPVSAGHLLISRVDSVPGAPALRAHASTLAFASLEKLPLAFVPCPALSGGLDLIADAGEDTELDIVNLY